MNRVLPRFFACSPWGLPATTRVGVCFRAARLRATPLGRGGRAGHPDPAAWVDSLRYDETSHKKKVVLVGDVPEFGAKWVPTIEVETWYPITSRGHAKVGARLYDRLEPSPWSVYVGYTINAEDVFGSRKEQPAEVGERCANQMTLSAHGRRGGSGPCDFP